MKFKVEIKEPCHESWDNMHLSEQGRFCDMCSKEVVDFTGKTRQQITETFQAKTTSVCGRFTQTQLERTYGEQSAKYSLYSVAQKAAVLLGIGLASPTIAQKPETPTAIVERDKARAAAHEMSDSTKVACETKKPSTEDAYGEISMVETDDHYLFKGQLFHLENEPLIGGTIMIEETETGAITDIDGTFQIVVLKSDINKIPTDVRLSYVGYESDLVSLSPSETKKAILNGHSLLGEVVTLGGAFRSRSRPRLHQRFLNIFRKKENHRW